MKQFLFIVALVILLPTVTFANPKDNNTLPLSLPWGQSLPATFLEIPSFKYWYGDMKWGEMIFTGNFQNLDAEVSLTFARNMISSATLILGPKGMETLGCKRTFIKVVNLLKQKYGSWKHTKIIESEDKFDLFYTNLRAPIRNGVHVEEVRWETEKFFIVAYLFGDEGEVFIEIDYFYRPLRGSKKNKDIKILKKL